MGLGFDSGEKDAGFGFEDGGAVGGAGEGDDGVEGIEEIDDDEFRFDRSVGAEDVAAAVALDAPDAGEDFGGEERLVGVRVFGFGPASPMSRDHRVPMILRNPAGRWG